MKSVTDACKPRREVLHGDLDDAIFAAEFGHVVEGCAPGVYQQPKEFFANTHAAAPLKKVVTAIFGRLTDPVEAGAAVRLSTGFGGGKTHTLIALWHLAKNPEKTTLGTELLPAAGRPSKVAVAGFDGEKTGSEVVGRHGQLVTRSLWGELAFQLGKKAGYHKVQAVDNPETAPDAGLIRALLPADQPVLLLLDELVAYMAKLSDRGRRCLIEFLRTLVAEVGARRQAVIVITDPGDQAAYRKEASTLDEALDWQEAGVAMGALDDVLGRKMSDYDPIKGEEAQVITRRLFDKRDKGAAEAASAEYLAAYQRVTEEYPGSLPPEAAHISYAARIVACYPFHPRLMETAQDRLGALDDFNKSRGTLRLFARIVRDVWDQRRDLALITAGDLDWNSDRIQGDLLQRLKRDKFRPAVDADVVRHAGQLDADFETDMHRRVATALLVESLPLNPNAAMDKRDLTLAVLRPTDVGHEPGEAMDRLIGVCWHTYKDDSGGRYQFRYEPNVNKLVEERAQNVPFEDARQAVLTRAQEYLRGTMPFRLISYPSSPKAVADSSQLKLILSESEELAKRVCEYEDDSDPVARRPRALRNAIFGLAPTVDQFYDAVLAMQRLLAARDIAKEEKRRSPLREQVEELLPSLERRAKLRALRAFSRVVFQGRPSVTLDEKYLVSEDSAMEATNGQARLKQFLDDHGYVYQPTDTVDVDLLVAHLLPGATPSLDHAGAFPASAVHERALSSEKLRLMVNDSPVRGALLKAAAQGRLVVRLANGDVFDDAGCVSGPEGGRRRAGRPLNVLPLTHDTLVAPRDAPCCALWLKVDDVQADYLTLAEAANRKLTAVETVAEAVAAGYLDSATREGQPRVVNNERFRWWEPVGAAPTTVFSWADAIEHATRRPLRVLQLKATQPETAKTLMQLAQPFGAKTLRLRVDAGGPLKDGGTVQFLADGIKHNSPLKPIDTAAMLRRGMSDEGSFEASLSLDFGEGGLPGAASKLEQAQQAANESVQIEAEFGQEE